MQFAGLKYGAMCACNHLTEFALFMRELNVRPFGLIELLPHFGVCRLIESVSCV
jgi:hypothetical protein